MSKTTVQLQRRLERVVILRPEEIARKKIKVRKVYAPLPNEPIEILRSERVESKPRFFQEFNFSEGELVQLEIEKPVQTGPSIDEIQSKVQKSYDRGFSDGQEITSATLQVDIEKLESWARQIDDVLFEIRNEYNRILLDFEQTVITLAVNIAEKIIDREISANSDVVINQVKKTIAQLDDQFGFKVRINPADYDIIESVKSQLVLDPNNAMKIELIVDGSVKKGGCKIETISGILDANIGSQLAKLKRELELT